ncbi:Cloroperoxidase [Didymella exigua CBS 183.55]|uniref:Cloroperoxidase n=1 Tax=Didymella exigua CBS 183.55 TaxID=1150837 RepID=A0A6A5R5X8_9PLEO|nr:Cloroperoxidase [Didymella exigua CBS 183.55]KAF1923551.1 Cloroperoxidase [Didymella exigua CBS 183.55]
MVIIGSKGLCARACLVPHEYAPLQYLAQLTFSMRLTIVAGALVASVVAHPQGGSLLGLPLNIAALLKSLGPAPADDPRFTDFKPAGSGDVRSPCPALNSLANHGFIPHNGKGNTIPILLKGLAEGLNVGADFTTAIGGAGLLASPNSLGGSFDLDDLNMHNFPIEHDASISRQDAALGNLQPFYDPNWQQYIRFFDGKTVTDVPTASKAKFARYNDSLAKNPDFTYGVREAVLSYGENALYLQTMGDPVNGNAKIEYVRSMFEKEQLPYNLGWRPSKAPITLNTLGAMVAQLFGNSPEPVPEGARIVADSYKDALVAIVGGSKSLANLTGGISEVLGL